MNQQHFPILLHGAQQTLPVDLLVLEQYQVSNIGAIVTFTVLNEHFRPDQICDGGNPDLVVEEFCGFGILEPIAGNRSHEVGRSKNEIHVRLPFEDFRNPAFVKDLRPVAQ